MDHVDRVLLDWYEWECGWKPVQAYQRSASFGERYASSRQWMTARDVDDEVDVQLRERTARLVEPLVAGLDLRRRIALNTHVRNLSAGAQVWRNPSRWSDTQGADVQKAKAVLRPQLAALGLIISEPIQKKVCHTA